MLNPKCAFEKSFAKSSVEVRLLCPYLGWYVDDATAWDRPVAAAEDGRAVVAEPLNSTRCGPMGVLLLISKDGRPTAFAEEGRVDIEEPLNPFTDRERSLE